MSETQEPGVEWTPPEESADESDDSNVDSPETPETTADVLDYSEETSEDSPDQPSEKVHADESDLSLEEVANQVVAGHWGVGQERRRRLAQAGYNAQDVEDQVTKVLNPPRPE